MFGKNICYQFFFKSISLRFSKWRKYTCETETMKNWFGYGTQCESQDRKAMRCWFFRGG
jgi:hypothetical protein